MNQILQGWKRILHDYLHWKMILKNPYDAFDCAVFFGNLAEPPNSLEDWVKEMKKLDPECQKILYDNLWEPLTLNTNPDRNTTTFEISCGSCGRMWKGKTCMGETTYEEVKND